jgi:hypothetical protein
MPIKPARGPVKWVLKATGFGGVTLPPWGIFILPERINEPDLRRHEEVHWAQAQRMGIVKYYLTYLWQVLRYGYHDAPMEREARGVDA